LQNAVVEQDMLCNQGEQKMRASQINEEIRESNLSYMLLAQQMIQGDKVSAIFRLGISEETADLIAGLTPAQILKMAASNMLLCRFRFDERLMLNMITDFNKDRMMSQVHATILMSAQPVEALAA
jgi:flagellar transcriptional activator FlhD